MFRKISQFIADVKGELKKTTWPWESDSKVKGFKKFRELWGSTLVVLVAMLFLGAYVTSFDIILHNIVSFVMEAFLNN